MEDAVQHTNSLLYVLIITTTVAPPNSEKWRALRFREAPTFGKEKSTTYQTFFKDQDKCGSILVQGNFSFWNKKLHKIICTLTATQETQYKHAISPHTPLQSRLVQRVCPTPSLPRKNKARHAIHRPLVATPSENYIRLTVREKFVKIHGYLFVQSASSSSSKARSVKRTPLFHQSIHFALPSAGATVAFPRRRIVIASAPSFMSLFPSPFLAAFPLMSVTPSANTFDGKRHSVSSGRAGFIRAH